MRALTDSTNFDSDDFNMHTMLRTRLLMIAALCVATSAVACIDGPSGSASVGEQDMDMTVATPDMGGMEEMGTIAEDMRTPEPDMPAEEDMFEEMGSDQGGDLDMSVEDMPAEEDMPRACVSGRGFNTQAPFRICNAEDFEEIRNAPSKVFELGDDITLPPDFQPIPSFNGELRGKDFTISGVNLTNTKAMNAACQDSTGDGYAGGFINVLDGGVVRDVTFLNVRVGEENSPLSSFGTGCQLIVGGIFGNIVESDDARAPEEGGIDNVQVRGLQMYTKTPAGGFAGQIQESKITNTHVLGDGISAIAINAQDSAGGFAYRLIDSELSRVSFQGNLYVIGPETTEHSLFLVHVIGTTNKLDNLVARGTLLATDMTSNAAGLIANISQGSRADLSLCASEANIETKARRVGGLISEFTGSPASTTSIALCYSGQLSTSQRTTIRGNDVVGGVLGQVRTPNGEEIQLTSVWAHLDIDTFAPSLMTNAGCTVGAVDNGDGVILIDVHPPDPGPMSNFPFFCNGRASIDPPGGATFFKDVGGIYRIRSVEAWFAPLRDPRLSLSQ